MNTDAIESRFQPIMILSCMIITVLLFCRDVLAIEIGKTIFTAIILFTAFCVNIPNAIYYMFFLFPLGTGLPTNYFIIFFLIKFAVNASIMQDYYLMGFKKTMITLALVIFVIIQNILMKHTGMNHLAVALNFILLLYMTTFVNQPDIKKLLTLNIISLFIVAFTMFFATISESGFISLLDGTFRFGETSIYTGSGEMKIFLDPNYLCVFCLSSLTSTYIMLRKHPTFLSAIILSVLSIFTGFVGLVTLSRAYILVLFGFIGLAMLAGEGSMRNSVRNIFMVIVLAAIAFFAIKSFYPELLETILARFDEDNTITGNGRTITIAEGWFDYTASIVSFFLGFGLFDNQIHCVPIQVLYGLGLFGALLYLLFYCECFKSIVSSAVIDKTRKHYSYIPLIVMFVMSLSLPLGTSPVMMFPFITAMYACRLANE